MRPALPEPISKPDRVPLVDALRGFALFGILFGNMTWFTGYAVLSPEQRLALGTERIDTSVSWMIQCLVDEKFWSLFALLFGAGVAMQWARAESRGENFRPLLVRRLIVLVIIGLMHAVFLWFGDIVSLYAVVGFGLFFFYRCRPGTILVWALALLLFLPLIQNLVWVLVHPSTDTSHGPAELLPVFQHGNYAEVFSANWTFLTKRWFLVIYEGRFFKLLGMFLLGYWMERQGVFRRPADNRSLLLWMLAAGLLIGLPGNAALATMTPPAPSLVGWGFNVLAAIAVPSLCLAYVAGLTLLSTSESFSRGLRIFGPAGRMSLTHYVGQSVIGIVVFYGYGFGNWGRMGVAWSVPMIVVIFALQTWLSIWWLARFKNGPLEWMWRCLSYGRMLPLRCQRSETPTSASRLS